MAGDPDGVSVRRPPYFRHVGIEPVGVHGDGRLQMRDEITNSAGYVHGGALSALLNFSMVQALHAALPDARCALVTIAVQFLAPTKGPVTSSATVERAGRNIAFLRATATAESGTVAVGTAVFHVSMPAANDAHRTPESPR